MENRKRVNRGGPRNETMEERIRRQGKEFFPIAFETSGASTSQCSKLLKKLSEIALQRRGHNKAYFVRRWKSRIALALAKRGCEVALARTYVVGGRQRGLRGVREAEMDDGPLLDGAADAFIHGDEGAV